MDDLISRQAAIDAIHNLYAIHGSEGSWIDQKDAFKALNSLPSAQPERKKGHWQIYIISMLDGEGCKCSECGHEGVPYWDFCPNCGALMDGEVEGRKK